MNLTWTWCSILAIISVQALPTPNVFINPTEIDQNAICPPRTIYVNGTCIRRCENDLEDDSCVRCPPESEYSNGQCVQCNRGLYLKNGRCTCPASKALLNGECVTIRVQMCNENEILSEGRCVPLYCYGSKCCKSVLCNSCFESCQQLKTDTASLSRCQQDCINDIPPSMPPFLVPAATPQPQFQDPIIISQPSQPTYIQSNQNPIIVNRPSPPNYNPPMVYPPVVVSRPSNPVYQPNVQSPIVISRPSNPVYQPDVQSPIVVSRPSSPVYQPNVQSPIVISRPSSPVYQPNVLSPVIVNRPSSPIVIRPNPVVIPTSAPVIVRPAQPEPPVVIYQQSSRPSQIISTSARNTSNVMDITNIVNSTNLENIDTKINNTNINHIKLGSSSSSGGLELSTNGEESNAEVIKREECCVITEPRKCLNESDKVVCYHRRRHVCGDQCQGAIEETVLTETEDQLIPRPHMQQMYPQQPMFVQQPMFQQYPQYQQPMMPYQQGCMYIPQWPYVRC